MASNKIAIVTGGSRGIGRNAVLNLARRGVDSIITYKSNQTEADKVVALVREAGARAIALPLDTGDSTRFDAFAAEVRNALAYQSVGFGMAPDTVFGTGGSQQLIQTWGGRGAFNHNWDPYWSSAIYGAYADVHYNGAAKTLVCGNGVTGGSFQAFYGAGVTSCNPDFSIAQLGTITRWTPVKNLTFSGEFVYTHLDQNMSGVAALSSSLVTGKPTALYQLKDQDTYQLLLRAQRNW